MMTSPPPTGFLRRAANNLLSRLARRIVRELVQGEEELRPNILRMAELRAAWEAAEYHAQHLSRVLRFESDLALLEFAFKARKRDGLILEFGVATGRTTNHLASLTDEIVYGFDSFAGLPEFWRSGYDQGMFRQAALPKVADNVRLIEGLFEDTLPAFVREHPQPVSFLHIDCDLYSSTRQVFQSLGERIGADTVIVFDEYFNYPGWREHEHRAFQEFLGERGLHCEYIGFVPSHQQVSVRILP